MRILFKKNQLLSKILLLSLCSSAICSSTNKEKIKIMPADDTNTVSYKNMPTEVNLQGASGESAPNSNSSSPNKKQMPSLDDNLASCDKLSRYGPTDLPSFAQQNPRLNNGNLPTYSEACLDTQSAYDSPPTYDATFSEGRNAFPASAPPYDDFSSEDKKTPSPPSYDIINPIRSNIYRPYSNGKNNRYKSKKSSDYNPSKDDLDFSSIINKDSDSKKSKLASNDKLNFSSIINKDSDSKKSKLASKYFDDNVVQSPQPKDAKEKNDQSSYKKHSDS